MARLTDRYGDIILTRNYLGDLEAWNEPHVHLYEELEKLAAYEDICDDPEKLKFIVDMLGGVKDGADGKEGGKDGKRL